NQLETGIETVRTDIRATPAAQRIEVDVAGAFDFPRQLDAELEYAVGQQRNMADQTQPLGRDVDDIADRLAGLAVVHTEVVAQVVPFDDAFFFNLLFHNPRSRKCEGQGPLQTNCRIVF